MGTGTFSLKNSKFFSGLKVPVPIVTPITTNGTVIVNAVKVTGAISPVIVNVYTTCNGSVYTNGCYNA